MRALDAANLEPPHHVGKLVHVNILNAAALIMELNTTSNYKSALSGSQPGGMREVERVVRVTISPCMTSS